MSFIEELDKIATIVAPEDMAAEPMTEEYMPEMTPEELEAIQAENGETPSPGAAEELLPPSPEDTEALQTALAEAEQELAVAKETLAKAQEQFEAFEKTANELNETLPGMGALARLIDFSTNTTVEPALQKLAQDRLTQALTGEESFFEVLSKTAEELFEDEENLNELYSDEGMDYVAEHLASFANDEELEKIALEVGGIFNKVKDTALEFWDATKNFQKLRGELQDAQHVVEALSAQSTQLAQNIEAARRIPQPTPEHISMLGNLQAKKQLIDQQYLSALRPRDEIARKVIQGGVGVTTGALGGVGAAVGAGKAIHNHMTKDPDVQLSEKTASDTIKEEFANTKGGYIDMSQSIVKDFLKIAGAAGLIDIANNEQVEEGLRKEAADAFNSIARMSRKDMGENLVKVATQIYTEEELHSIVAGNHNNELFEKVAFFIDAYEASADDLEKIAGAEGVAAKGVGGELTDAKKNIEEKIEADKVQTETVATGETGTKKPDDMRGYNVINNPGEYQVEKSASLLEEAELRKEAAFREYVAMDTFIKNNKQ